MGIQLDKQKKQCKDCKYSSSAMFFSSTFFCEATDFLDPEQEPCEYYKKKGK